MIGARHRRAALAGQNVDGCAVVLAWWLMGRLADVDICDLPKDQFTFCYFVTMNSL
jgi:hypothetical protein